MADTPTSTPAATPPPAASAPAASPAPTAPPAATPPPIYTQDTYKTFVQAGFKTARVQNHALLKLGSVDIRTGTTGNVIAVVKFAKATDADVVAQVTKLLAAAQPPAPVAD
jgi:hypothetical protein